MRVPTGVLFSNVTFSLGRLTEDMNRANIEISSQKRIQSMADDPSGLLQIMNLRSDLSGIDQLQRNIAMGKSWLTASESSLNNVQEIITQGRLLALQMGSDTAGSDERDAAAQTVQGLLESVVTQANSTVGGRYIFAGSDSSNPAFTLAGSAVTYEGDNTPFALRISRGSTVTVGGDGNAIFGSLFTVFADLKTALENDDSSDILAEMGNLQTAFENMNAQISVIGGRSMRMDTRENILADIELANTERMSTIEDVDYAEAIIKLKASETAYQAALSSASKVLNVSLVNYL